MKEKYIVFLLIISGLFSCSMLSYSINIFPWFDEYEGAFKLIVTFINIPIYLIILLHEIYYKRYFNYITQCLLILYVPFFTIFLSNYETQHFIMIFNFLIYFGVSLFLIIKRL
jgi:hypothetical protein